MWLLSVRNVPTFPCLPNYLEFNLQLVYKFLASQGGGRKGDLSRFIEEAVRAHILALSAEQAKTTNAAISGDELAAAVDEAVQWARNH